MEFPILEITQRELLVMLIAYPACIVLLGVFAYFHLKDGRDRRNRRE